LAVGECWVNRTNQITLHIRRVGVDCAAIGNSALDPGGTGAADRQD
jgi:hypothetical protein